jgi:hypothetical protein
MQGGDGMQWHRRQQSAFTALIPSPGAGHWRASRAGSRA